VCLNSLRLLVAGRFHETWPGRAIARVAALYREDIPNLMAAAWRNRGRSSAAALALLALAWLATGFYRVQPGEIGLERRFGRIVRQAEPGLHYRWPRPAGRVDRVATDRLHTLEIGFRTVAGAKAAPASEPAAYEWSARHTIGRYEKNIDEAMMLTGDENLIEATLVVHYRIENAVAYLTNLGDAEGLLRACAEASARAVVSRQTLVAALAADRAPMEQETAGILQRTAERLRCGIRVENVFLQDVHPPLEVVEDFRAVSSAYEERHRLVNEAEAYAAETVELAKGRSAETVEKAKTYRAQKEKRSEGDAGKFAAVAAAYAAAPEVAALRLFLEAAETGLAPVRKVIVDRRRQGRSQLLLLDEASLAPLLSKIVPPPAAPAEPPPVEE